MEFLSERQKYGIRYNYRKFCMVLRVFSGCELGRARGYAAYAYRSFLVDQATKHKKVVEFITIFFAVNHELISSWRTVEYSCHAPLHLHVILSYTSRHDKVGNNMALTGVAAFVCQVVLQHELPRLTDTANGGRAGRRWVERRADMRSELIKQSVHAVLCPLATYQAPGMFCIGWETSRCPAY